MFEIKYASIINHVKILIRSDESKNICNICTQSGYYTIINHFYYQSKCNLFYLKKNYVNKTKENLFPREKLK